MKSIKIISIVAILTFSIGLVKAQNYHLIYETDIFSIDLNKAALNDTSSKFSVKKGQHHIITFKNKKAISFQLDTLQTNENSFFNPNKHNSYLIVDNKKSKYQWVIAGYNKKVDKIFVNSYDKKAWLNNDPTIEPAITEEYKFINEAIKSKFDSLPKWKAPEITYTEQNKEINGYFCKHAIVLTHEQILSVWFTEEINFNWCFADYRVLIPGTVVQIEKENKIVFNLVSIAEYDENKSIIKLEIINNLRKLK